MRRIVTLATLFGFAALPAGAQTVLTIAATGQAETAPDEAVASLTAQANAPDAATAQGDVNAAMTKALAEVRAVPGLKATTGGYQTIQMTDSQTQRISFQASQSLQLTMPAAGGVPAPGLTALLDRLQQQGLLLNELDGDLSATARAAAEQAAILAALGRIEAQAEAVAAQLHERVGPMKTLNVNAAQSPGPVPMLAMARAAVAPVSAPGNIQVSADVTATIELDAAQN